MTDLCGDEHPQGAIILLTAYVVRGLPTYYPYGAGGTTPLATTLTAGLFLGIRLSWGLAALHRHAIIWPPAHRGWGSPLSGDGVGDA